MPVLESCYGEADASLWWQRWRIFFMACFANGLKLAEELKGSKRGLLGAVLLAIVLTMASSIYLIMEMAYAHGGINLHNFFFIFVPQVAFTYVAPKFDSPVPASLDGWAFTGIGALLMGLFTYIRYRFVWWPIHPVGLAISGSYLARRTSFTVFIAWLIKLVMLKIGGPAFYRKSRPLFVGLLVGYVLGVALSAGIDVIWFPERGHSVHRY